MIEKGRKSPVRAVGNVIFNVKSAISVENPELSFVPFEARENFLQERTEEIIRASGNASGGEMARLERMVELAAGWREGGLPMVGCSVDVNGPNFWGTVGIPKSSRGDLARQMIESSVVFWEESSAANQERKKAASG